MITKEDMHNFYFQYIVREDLNSDSLLSLNLLEAAENMFTMSARKMTAEPMLRVWCIVFQRSIWKRYCLPKWSGCSVHRWYWLGFAMKTLLEF